MSNKGLLMRNPGHMLHTSAPALNGDLVEQSLSLQQRLTNDALQSRTKICQILFPSALTKEVRAVECEMVLEQLRTRAEISRCVNDAGLTLLRALLDQVVTNGVADARADTSSRLLARREELEVILTASWRRFCEAAVEEQQWAERLPPMLRKRAQQRSRRASTAFPHADDHAPGVRGSRPPKSGDALMASILEAVPARGITRMMAVWRDAPSRFMNAWRARRLRPLLVRSFYPSVLTVRFGDAAGIDGLFYEILSREFVLETGAALPADLSLTDLAWSRAELLPRAFARPEVRLLIEQHIVARLHVLLARENDDVQRWVRTHFRPTWFGSCVAALLRTGLRRYRNRDPVTMLRLDPERFSAFVWKVLWTLPELEAVLDVAIPATRRPVRRVTPEPDPVAIAVKPETDPVAIAVKVATSLDTDHAGWTQPEKLLDELYAEMRMAHALSPGHSLVRHIFHRVQVALKRLANFEDAYERGTAQDPLPEWVNAALEAVDSSEVEQQDTESATKLVRRISCRLWVTGTYYLPDAHPGRLKWSRTFRHVHPPPRRPRRRSSRKSRRGSEAMPRHPATDVAFGRVLGRVGSWKGEGRFRAGDLLRFPDYLRNFHVAVFGRTGVGKSRFMDHLIQSDISRGAPFFSWMGWVRAMKTPCRRWPLVCSKWTLKRAEPLRRCADGFIAACKSSRADSFFWISRKRIRCGAITCWPSLLASSPPRPLPIFLCSFERATEGDLSEQRRFLQVVRAVTSVLIELRGTTLRDALDALAFGRESWHALINYLRRKRAELPGGEVLREEATLTYLSSFFVQLSPRDQQAVTQSTWNAINVYLGDPVVAKFLSSPVSTLDFQAILDGGKSLLIRLRRGSTS